MLKITSADQLQHFAAVINNIEKLDEIIYHYSMDVPGPAYLKVRHQLNEPEFQLDRELILPALRAQRKVYTDYLAGEGVEYDPT